MLSNLMQPQNYEFFTNHIFPLVLCRRNWQLENEIRKILSVSCSVVFKAIS